MKISWGFLSFFLTAIILHIEEEISILAMCFPGLADSILRVLTASHCFYTFKDVKHTIVLANKLRYLFSMQLKTSNSLLKTTYSFKVVWAVLSNILFSTSYTKSFYWFCLFHESWILQCLSIILFETILIFSGLTHKLLFIFCK